ncbi:MAG: homoserine kinase [Neisseriaceae bacterium]|nr:MAG: homoserine kinase [Neisseriaceae bacterium]
MSVYTTFDLKTLETFLENYSLGELITYRGISGGITNTNYFVDTTHGRYVLTIFEQLKAEELPFYLNLTLFLNQHQIACPAPVPQINGKLFGFLKHKPAILVTCLNGSAVEYPNEQQCFNVGAMLAKMHVESTYFSQTMSNPRYKLWWNNKSNQLFNLLPRNDQLLLKDELNFLNNHMIENLPNGIIHADLFRDNVLIYNNEVAGFIDFYYACNGLFIYDLAITINDWSRTQENTINIEQEKAILAGYERIRALTDQEKEYFLIAKRSAAIRFWISRLLDFHFPVSGEITFTKNPDDFRNLLLFYRQKN